MIGVKLAFEDELGFIINLADEINMIQFITRKHEKAGGGDYLKSSN